MATDVVMLNPATDDPLVGRQAVAEALGVVAEACDEFRHAHLLADTSASDPTVFGLVFEARVGGESLQGVDPVQLDEHDRIRAFTVMARPLTALMALGARMSSRHQP